MPQQLRIDVRLPDGHWAGDVTRANPLATLRIEQHMPLSRGRGTARCWSNEPLNATVESHAGIDDLTLLDEGHFNVNISAGGGGFLRPLVDLGVVPRTPFEVQDGWVEWTVEGSKEQMRELIARFKGDETPYRLLSTRSTNAQLLTPRQREVFEVASREGYWDVPRRISLTELAALLGVAKSTLSHLLQRIESSVFNAFTDDIRRMSG
ncbi:helix-turn-helix domain-containing protein [Candidatus Poseidonia sp.]|nr:helix-turn-helix domain-containing protein [Poseidonia sp.]